MNAGRLDPYAAHEQVVALLPWYVNGTLTADERALVEGHVAVCLRCRSDLGNERRLAGAMRDVDVEMLAARNAFAVLEQRLRGPSRRSHRRHLLRVPRPSRRLVLAAAALAALTVAVLPREVEPPSGDAFRTLAQPTGNHAPVPGGVRVVFADALDAAARRALVARLGGRIVGSPGAGGVYTIAPAGTAEVPTLLAALRASPAVRFAEPSAAAAVAR
ncbi:MAG: zf-HC2 domain-containing protein [Gammaproteobacteria bacterium]